MLDVVIKQQQKIVLDYTLREINGSILVKIKPIDNRINTRSYSEISLALCDYYMLHMTGTHSTLFLDIFSTKCYNKNHTSKIILSLTDLVKC